MGWLIVGMIMFVAISLVSRINARRKKPGRHKVADVEIYDRVERECRNSEARQGEFEIDLDELSDLDWLELESHEFSKDRFRATVKWRNQGTQCIYKFVAIAGNAENGITKQSKKNIIPIEP